MPRTAWPEPPEGVPTSTTAPNRGPGTNGVKVTEAVQATPCASVAEAQFAAPVPGAKSPLGDPTVTMRSLLTVPATDAVTGTAWLPVIEPTACGPNCAWELAPASSSARTPARTTRLCPVAGNRAGAVGCE